MTAVVFCGICFWTLDAELSRPHSTLGARVVVNNWVLLDFRMVAERLCSTRSVIRGDDARK